MSDVYAFSQGDSPLLISVPHDGRLIPDAQRARMTEAGLAIPDTDWHVAELYGFARDLGASLLV
ncbi:MAG: N-formylglutamate amidohydrolase, partial [Gammaproteobacteria bacterium]|nr:N-formylglutamate amidohydrolase [Gammaproteobacteria bacterium]